MSHDGMTSGQASEYRDTLRRTTLTQIATLEAELSDFIEHGPATEETVLAREAEIARLKETLNG